MAQTASDGPTTGAWLLSALGLLAFIGLTVGALGIVDDWRRVLAGAALHAYGGVLLAFWGGCRWSFSASGHGPGLTILAAAIAIAPMAYAVAGLTLMAYPKDTLGLRALAVGHAVMLLEDWRATRAGWAPRHWFALRLPLGIAAVACLFAPYIAWRLHP